MKMDGESLARLQSYPLCLRCKAVLLGIDRFATMTFEEVATNVKERTKRIEAQTDQQMLCLCCMNAFEEGSVYSLAEKVYAAIQTKQCTEVALVPCFPPILDAYRVACRAYVCMDINKSIAFPTFEAFLSNILAGVLKCRYGIQVNASAKWMVSLSAKVVQQRELAHILAPDFRAKKGKRKHWESEESYAQVKDEINRKNTDYILKSWKNINPSGLRSLRSRLDSFHKNILNNGLVSSQEVKYDISIYYEPIYLFGRYCKYARDVSQSPWMVTADKDDDAEGDVDAAAGAGTGTGEAAQKGRGSVEDIISQAVTQLLSPVQVKLHGCGREDIDVRCLGNGRPFALEIQQAAVAPSEELVKGIMININSAAGLNSASDISLLQLQLSDVSMWERMQKEAEEKDKRYCCLVWSSSPISYAALQALELASCQQRDTSHKPCLQIMQKTPLRVLHRRSLIDRSRFIYQIKTLPLNQHYFIMELDTSAGTYVKEFVHGDLGRTVPSISSLLQCQAEILQLDVTWLYDGFQESLPMAEQQVCQVARDEDSCAATWQVLKQTRRAPVRAATPEAGAKAAEAATL